MCPKVELTGLEGYHVPKESGTEPVLRLSQIRGICFLPLGHLVMLESNLTVFHHKNEGSVSLL
jgi:hypothetical protein